MFNAENHWLRHISEQELNLLGLNVVAYIKPVEDKNNKTGVTFDVCSADGSVLGSFKSFELAAIALKQNDLVPLSLH